MKNALLIMIFCFLLSAGNVIGQAEYTTVPATPEARRNQEDYNNRVERAQQNDSLQRLKNIQTRNSSAVKGHRLDPLYLKTIEENKKSVETAKKMVEPTAIHRQKYQSYLKSSKTKIAIIFPDIDCESPLLSKIISVEDAERCRDALKIQKNGSLYSFDTGKNYITLIRKNAQKLDGWWDIHYTNQNLVVGNCCRQGIITDLGNMDIDGLTVTSPGLETLAEFKAYTTATQIRQQYQSLIRGIKLKDYTYQRAVKAQVGHTYAVRSIAYKTENEKEKTPEIDVLSDQIVVFKLVEMESNGSLILIWKNLSSKK